jgi:hypothetical protein
VTRWWTAFTQVEWMDDPRTEILHVRLTKIERARLRDIAKAEYLEQSVWARQAILQAIDAWKPPVDRKGRAKV